MRVFKQAAALSGTPDVSRFETAAIGQATAGHDYLAGDANDNVIHGRAGDDTIEDFLGGSDRLYGDAGDDTIRLLHDSTIPGSTKSKLMGGDGDDTLWAGADAKHKVVLDGGAGADHLSFSSSGTGSGTLVGGDGDDVFDSDWALKTVIDGGAGNDWVNVTGGVGRYDMTLGAGADEVLMTRTGGGVGSPYTLTFRDFQTGAGGDVLDLSLFLSDYLVGWTGSNPFLAGYVRLSQHGTSTVLQMDSQHDGGWSTLATFENTSAASFAAENLKGVAPTGGEFDLVFKGGEGVDVFMGRAGSDLYRGFGGNDLIQDWLNGNDTLQGGDGDDTLQVEREAAPGATRVLIDGGAGVDTISFMRFGSGAAQDRVTIKGGDGADQITVSNAKVVTIDAGAGNDYVYMRTAVATLTLGEGFDRVTIDTPAAAGGYKYVFTDFEAGANGDKVEFNNTFYHLTTELYGHDPFADGYLRLVQDGSTARLQIDFDGGGDAWHDFIDFQHASADAFTSYNLGFDPG